ncbi:MAG: MBL fold metallo-hydrolase, partial [Candidatus Poseidonia sp.]|nr:MBL fold metallo-hydrolase [Poseidonia sp.]
MRFEQLNEGVWAMTYLIADEATNEAALVDPV